MIQGSFQGKRGIFTYDFIKKPSYYVYEMLAKMGFLFYQKRGKLSDHEVRGRGNSDLII